MRTSLEPLFDFYFQRFYHKKKKSDQNASGCNWTDPASTNQSIETCYTLPAAVLVVYGNASTASPLDAPPVSHHLEPASYKMGGGALFPRLYL